MNRIMVKRIGMAAMMMIVLGGITIPGGLGLNAFIRDLTFSSLDEGLLGIKSQGVPLVEESIYQRGPATALTMAAEIGADVSAPTVNATFFMGEAFTVLGLGTAIEDMYWNLNKSGTWTFSALLSLFGYPAIKGVAEWYGADLNFTVPGNYSGLDHLKYGVNTTANWWGTRLPGIFEDTYVRVGDTDWPPTNSTDAAATIDTMQDRGFGVIELMDIIANATEVQVEEMAGVGGYNVTNPTETFSYNNGSGTFSFNKLKILYYYYTQYFSQQVISMIIAKFNEVGSPLYNSYPQYRPRDWNGNFTEYKDLTFYSFIEQWAKCLSYDNGVDFSNMDSRYPPGTTGLEPAGPGVDSGIPMQAALQLWNISDPYSIVNFTTGIMKWYNAKTDTSVYQELLTHFGNYPGYDYENDTYGDFGWGFNNTDMDLLLDWLWGNGGGWHGGSFSRVTLPKLLTTQYGVSLPEFCFNVLLEQWVNGSTMGHSLYPLGIPLPLGTMEISGFEVGYQGPGMDVVPTYISLDSAKKLWDNTSSYSLVTEAGLKQWFAACDGDLNARSTLKTQNGLDPYSMALILNWIPNFQHNVMPYLAQYQYNLPTDSITLGEMIQNGGLILGSVLVGFGAVVEIRRRRLSRRNNLLPKQQEKVSREPNQIKGYDAPGKA